MSIKSLRQGQRSFHLVGPACDALIKDDSSLICSKRTAKPQVRGSPAQAFTAASHAVVDENELRWGAKKHAESCAYTMPSKENLHAASLILHGVLHGLCTGFARAFEILFN